MTIKERLQIILITYNRAPYLRNTLAQLFSENSPVKDFHFTILDNKSTDETPIIISEYQKHHPNLSHIIHNHNIGGNANIARALELATYDYAWFICDDDTFHWEGWDEVEKAIADNEPMICACNFNVKTEYRDRLDYLFYQMTFLPSCIFSRRVLSDLAIRNAYDNVFTWFPHLAPVALHLNNQGTIKLLSKGLVTPDTVLVTRSTESEKLRNPQKDLTHRSQTMNFILGYANVLTNLKRNDREKFFMTLMNGNLKYPGRLESWGTFYRNIFLHWNGRENQICFTDLLSVAPFSVRIILHAIRLLQTLRISSLLYESPIYWFIRRYCDKRNANNITP